MMVSAFTLAVGTTFLAKYKHGTSLAGVTVTSSVKTGAQTFPLTFTVTDVLLGEGTFSADTTAWSAGNYFWDIKRVASGIVTNLDEPVRFTMRTPVTP